MAERLNATVLKTVIPRDRDRGFESLSLHQSSFFELCWQASYYFEIYAPIAQLDRASDYGSEG